MGKELWSEALSPLSLPETILGYTQGLSSPPALAPRWPTVSDTRGVSWQMILIITVLLQEPLDQMLCSPICLPASTLWESEFLVLSSPGQND